MNWSKKQLTAAITAVATIAGALGYSGGGIDHPVTAETAAHQAHKIAEVERRLERVEKRTVDALEDIAERLTLVERKL